MARLNQIYLNLRKKVVKLNKRRLLEGCPQRKGTCFFTGTVAPKKPNSAKRAIAKVYLQATGKLVLCFIPGVGHNLQKHSSVLVRGGRTKDLPGFKYKVIRGKYDAGRVLGRVSSRSKYGVKVTRHTQAELNARAERLKAFETA